ncbi:conserved Plasmodium protein, unknown function [Plasmodium sp. gorilla clade G2]|uniref:conserved Plasmodium protein, unknown function n=1 Tax=Plasmodium sp. gorilla clade G2 TaxID=880535 RepID=UPI000D207B07|nr:conserved Plasmodium protein, unknown function [Plasmodium sp. gorilla clade G2]SOV16575.1 conserved Plasmodium protein, unknown function [Plasmodium sp. gorilla clade G2]
MNKNINIICNIKFLCQFLNHPKEIKRLIHYNLQNIFIYKNINKCSSLNARSQFNFSTQYSASTLHTYEEYNEEKECDDIQLEKNVKNSPIKNTCMNSSIEQTAVNNIDNERSNENIFAYHNSVLNELIHLRDSKNRDEEKIKLLMPNILKNIHSYNIYEITEILNCLHFFNIIIVKREDINRLISRLKILTFNIKEKDHIYPLVLNLLKLNISKDNMDEHIFMNINKYLNDLLRHLLLCDNIKDILKYIYHIREIQVIYEYDFCSWINKKYIDKENVSFLQSFNTSIILRDKELDYIFINNIKSILYELNFNIHEINIYNYLIPIFLKEFNVIVECISDYNTFQGTLCITPYFIQRYKLFKKMNFKVLFLYKQLIPEKKEDKIIYIKNCLYDILK